MFALPLFSVRFSAPEAGRSEKCGGACLVLPCTLVLVAAAIPTWTAQAQCAHTRMEASLVQKKSVAADTGSLPSALAIPAPSPQDLQSRWSREDISWAYATGRANLSTYIPTLVGTYLPSFSDSKRLTTVGLGVMGAGLLAGPSMGQWCLGGRYARESILPTLVRAAGEGEIIWVMVWGTRQIENAEGLGGGVGAMLATSFLALPGILVAVAGAAWSMNRTPPPRMRFGRAKYDERVGRPHRRSSNWRKWCRPIDSLVGIWGAGGGCPDREGRLGGWTAQGGARCPRRPVTDGGGSDMTGLYRQLSGFSS